MNKVGALLVIILFAVSGWFHYQTHLQLTELKRQNKALNQQLMGVGEQLTAVSKALAKFESTSLDSIVRDANDALISGWESLVDTVAEELKKARDGLPQAAPTDPASPPLLESPDGTERI